MASTSAEEEIDGERRSNLPKATQPVLGEKLVLTVDKSISKPLPCAMGTVDVLSLMEHVTMLDALACSPDAVK